MEHLRSVIVLIHLLGFAALFGSWIVEAVSRRFRVAKLMGYGLLIAGVAGLTLAVPWPPGIELNYIKIAVKFTLFFLIGFVHGLASARQRRHGDPHRWQFWLVGTLTLGNAAIAVLW